MWFQKVVISEGGGLRIGHKNNTVKIRKIRTPEKNAVIILKQYQFTTD